MKKALRLSALVIALGLGAHASAGVPVIDGVSNGARMVEFTQTVAQWSKEIAEMQQQYQMLTNQYTQLQRTFESANGARDWANVANNVYDKGEDWQEKLDNTDYTALKEAAKIVGVEDTTFASGSDAATAMENAQNTNASNQAMNQANYKRIQKRMGSLETLMARINTATDAKDIADITARINAEQLLLQNEQNSLAMTSALQQGQRDIQEQQGREIALKMSKMKKVNW